MSSPGAWQQGRYKKVLWKYVRVGDIIHLSNNELIPADVLLLRSSEPHGLCYIDTCNLDGETNLKQRTVVRGFMEKQNVFEPKHFDSLIEVDAPSTKIYKFHGSLMHPTGERVPVTTDNLLLRECIVKNTDFVEGVVVYAGHETKALLNNGGPRYKRSGIERQMNRDIIWCVLILLVLCVVGAIGCRMWLFSYEPPVPFIPLAQEPNYEGFLTFFTFVIILQVMIPLSLYVSVEMTKLLQVYHIHNDVSFYDADTKKGIECRALNITEELGQVEYIFSDKTGTLTENKMVFRRCTANGVDYNHASPSNEQRFKTRPGAPMPVIANSKLQEDLSYIHRLNSLKKPNEVLFSMSERRRESANHQESELTGKIKHAQVLQELLLVLAICNTVVVSKHPHHDVMNASGIIEPTSLDYTKAKRMLDNLEAKPPPVGEPAPIRTSTSPAQILRKKLSTPVLPTQKVVLSCRSNSDLGLKNFKSFPLHKSKSLENDRGQEKYSRLCESRSVTPSPPPPQVPLLNIQRNNGTLALPPRGLSPIPDRSPVDEPEDLLPKPDRPKLLNIPGLLFVGKKSRGNFVPNSKSPSPNDVKPIFEAESPDELALVEAAHTYDCRLLKRTPMSATIMVPGEGLVEFEILKVLPFDTVRKMMSVVVRHPHTQEITLYAKGADTSIFSSLSFTDNVEAQQNIFRTQQQINSYARQGLRVLVMAKRSLTESEFMDWLKAHKEVELCQENREKLMESYRALETNLTLIGATGTEDRLQDGVPECIHQLMSAGIVVWVLTGDQPETAINIAYSAKLFSPQMEILKLSARNKSAAESDIKFYLSDIKGNNPLRNNVHIDGRGVFGRGVENSTRLPEPVRSHRKRALVVDGKTLTFILDPKSKLQKPFLELTGLCSSVLCCRATPLQKAYIVRIVKEILHKKTLAIGDGANDVSMIQTADVGVGISGQEGMQAIMASDYALCKFKSLEKFLLVHGHWCYDRIARMVLYFFYKNATFVFLIFWFQLYCGYSAQVMIDQMYLMLYNLLFTSLPPLAIGVYEQDAPEELLMANPSLYSQGRLGLVYQPHSFWISMADSLYQSIVIFFITLGAYNDSDIGLWEFGTTITTACLFIMLAHVVIETKSWTIIHVISIFASIFLYFSFSLLYNGLCDDCLGLPSNYWVMQMMIVSPVFWLVILLTIVLALLPRFLYNCYSRWLSPQDVVRAVRERQSHVARGEEFLASWSRSTSTSSIYRTIDTTLKLEPNNTLTSVG
ncbi:hypothetical protein RUM43_013956 [Polyplax serrata]|uniref:Phospholipid-transporting ATPase n=1 Tax=Polyplax serrata TaxID=468196 RepID=A0AAN8NPY5_POLSC